MRQKILKMVIVISLIATLTFANFLLLGVNVISYAAEVINVNKTTNHKNVEFMAYFKDEEGKNVTEIDANTNVDSLPLYFKVAVKQEGYLNGQIILNDANFKLKTDILSDTVNKIEDNIIYLNQINAGEEKEIQVKIELKKEERIDIGSINAESSISIEGTYRNQQEKDIAINSNRNVTLNFVNPENISILTQEVITNKILSYNGQEKRIIQIEVKSGLKDNTFPLKQVNIKLQTPKISDKYPEEVLVNSNMNLVTNGNKLTSDNWNYDETTGLVNIEIENKQDNNTISWLKNGQDEFIITYIFDKNVEIENEKLKASSEISLYDLKNTKIMSESELLLTQDEKDNIIKTEIIQNEKDIFKGRLYAGIDRYISYVDLININLCGVTNQIIVTEEQQKISEKEINAYYKTSIFNIQNVQNILGKNGSIDIKNARTGDIIKTINNSSEYNENGDIVVTYPENVSEITIIVNNPEKEGTIEARSEKVIKTTNKTVLAEAKEISGNVINSYNLNEENVKLQDSKTSINLLETETSADLTLNKSDISTMNKNSIEMKVVLNSREEKNELYKNPIIRIQLPSKIENIKVTSINLLYENELKISSAKLIEGNIIEIKLQGEQTKYKEEAIDGATIIINAELDTSKKLTSSEEKITMTYTNQKAVNYKNGTNYGEVQKKLNIVSYMGLVTINKIPDYKIEVINNEGNKIANVELTDGNKEVEIQNQVINNEEKTIENVKILGNFPTKEAKDLNNMDVSIIDGLNVGGIDTSRVKVYYSNNANATIDINNKENEWTENITDVNLVKKYLVEVNKLDVTESIDLSYKTKLPEKLDYNLNSEQSYIVYYNNQGAEQKVETNNLSLITPKGAVLETDIKAIVSGKEATEVRENGILRYEINLENIGSEDVSNVVIKSKVPDGTKYVNTEKLKIDDEFDFSQVIDENKKEVEIVIDNLKQGQKVTKFFEVKVDENMAGKQITNIASVKYGEAQKETNTVTTSVKEGTLETVLVSVDSADGVVKSGYQYRFVLYVTNKSSKTLKNIETTITVSDIMKISEMYYIDSDDKSKIEEDTNKIKIDEIGAGQTIELAIYTYVNLYTSNEEKTISIKATCEENKNEYYSNEINLIAKSDFAFSMATTSENAGGYVSAGDAIKYNVVIKNEGLEKSKLMTLNNWISNDVTLTKVMKNGVELANDKYSLTIDSAKNQKVLKINEDELEAGKTVEYTIEVVVNLLKGNKSAIEIIYENSLNISAFEIEKSRIEHILQPENIPSDGDNNNGDNGNGNDNQQNNYKIISGIAWIDENENGQQDSNEKLLEGMTVKLIDVTTNEFVKDSDGKDVTAITNATGFYSFTKVKKGQYLVVFEYDATKYWLTAYKKEGIPETNNSDAISKTMSIEGQDKTVGITEIINVDSSNIANIDLGVIFAKKYDLQLDKYISKVVVQNDKTVSNNYIDETLVKEEINAKQLNNTTVVVEYTIRVTNKGDVTAYVKKIADYLSNDYKFNAELNSDWYQSGNDIYCTSLANEKLEPGQSKDVKLTVVKTMTESNTGLINNTAEIVESYNELGLKDVNSTEGNKIKGENDMGSADLILSIKTGQIIATVAITISIIALISLAVVIIIKKIINRRVM